MIYKHGIWNICFSFAALFIVSFSLSVNAQTLYSCTRGGGNPDPFLRTIDPDTGATLTSTEITLDGFDVRGCNGLARDPLTGVCWIIINVGSESPRILATIDEVTGVATEIGNMQDSFAGISFDTLGILYGVTGDGADTPETLFIINKNNSSSSEFLTLGDGNDGEAIAFNPADGQMYHASGNAVEIFERINLITKTITPITYSGDNDQIAEITSLVYQSDNIFLAGDLSEQLLSISSQGNVSFIGDTDHISKGLAFDCGVAPPPPPSATSIPTLSEWGLIAMAGLMGIAGFIVLRRKRLTA